LNQDLSHFCGGSKNTNGIQESSNPIKKDVQTLKEVAVPQGFLDNHKLIQILF
jgi:hypothetical protein